MKTASCGRLLVAVILTLLLAGCGSDDRGSSDSTSASLLSFVPDDSIFYFGSAKPVDRSEIIAILERMDFYKTMDIGDMVSRIPVPKMPAGKLLRQFYVDYLEALKNPETLGQSLGVGDDWNGGIYAVDAIPVIRFSIADQAAFNSFVDESEKKAGVSASISDIDGVTVRRYQLSKNTDTDATLDLAIASTDRFAMISAHGSKLDDDRLRRTLGLTRPEVNLETTGKLDEMMKAYGFQSIMAGFIDHRAIVNVLTADPSPTLQALKSSVPGADAPIVDNGLKRLNNEQCRTELSDIASRWPRTVIGYDVWDTGSKPMKFNGKAVLETNNMELLDQLKQLRGSLVSIPAGISERPVLVWAMGINADAITPFSAWLGKTLAAKSWKCAPLKEFADSAAGNSMATAAMVGGMASGVTGITLAVLGVEIGDPQDQSGQTIKNLDALVALAANNPGALIALARTFLPMLQDLRIPDDGSATAIPLPVPGTAGIMPMLAVRDGFITLFTGDMANHVVEQLDGANTAGPGFMKFQMDYKKYFELIDAGLTSSGLSEGQMSEQDRKIFQSMKEFDATVDFSVNISDQGIEMQSGMLIFH